MGLSYKGYNISCRPLKTDNLWQLELEKSARGIKKIKSLNTRPTRGACGSHLDRGLNQILKIKSKKI